MGINNPGGGSGVQKVFQNTLYVSPSFSNVSPFFSTIGAAMTVASAGTLIWVGPGTYQEQITWKEGVTLRGLSPDLCILDGNASGTPAITFTCNSVSFNAIENIQVKNVGNIAMELRFNADATLLISNSYIGGTPSSINCNIALRFFTCRATAVFDCVDSVIAGANNATNGAIQITNNFNSWSDAFKIRRSLIFGQLYFNQGCANPVIDSCLVWGNLNNLNAAGDLITFTNCRFHAATSTLFSVAGTTYQFNGCRFTNYIFQSTNALNAGNTVFQNCSWFHSTADTTLFAFGGGAGITRLDNFSLYNGKIVFSYVGTGTLKLSGGTIHNAGGTLSLDSGANVMTFASFNLTTDKPLGANITVAAGGVNNNFSAGI